MTPQVGPRTRARMLCFTVFCLSLLVRPATATVISYAFDPGSQFIETNSTVLPVSGNFTFDTTHDLVTGGAITISGPAPLPLTSTPLQQLFIGGAEYLQAFFNHDFDQSFVLSFTPALGTLGTSPNLGPGP